MTNLNPKGAHLVGSVPLANNSGVFAFASSLMGKHLRRMPDGETGERSNWIHWQFEVLRATPQLETVTYPADNYGNVVTQVKLRPGVSASEVVFGPLGYSEAALTSYAEFALMKMAGIVPYDCRFQVCLPTPLAPIQFYVAAEDRAVLEPIYEARLMSELQEILAGIPAEELAIQWDTAAEFGVIEGVFPSYLQDVVPDILARLVRLGESVPAGVELGYHLCYGDSGHRHFVEPADSGNLVTIANGIAAGLKRPLNWIHLPVPRERTDPAYYAPLKGLSLHDESELYLGLIHVTDDAEGAKKRIAAAQTAVTEFGVATECGFGRRPPETVPDLMQLHAVIADRIR